MATAIDRVQPGEWMNAASTADISLALGYPVDARAGLVGCIGDRLFCGAPQGTTDRYVESYSCEDFAVRWLASREMGDHHWVVRGLFINHADGKATLNEERAAIAHRVSSEMRRVTDAAGTGV